MHKMLKKQKEELETLLHESEIEISTLKDTNNNLENQIDEIKSLFKK